MDKTSRKLLYIIDDIGNINTQIQNLNEITYSNTRTIRNIRGKIENLLGRIQNVKAYIERSKKSSFSESSNDDLRRHILSFLDSLDIELTDILENI